MACGWADEQEISIFEVVHVTIYDDKPLFTEIMTIWTWPILQNFSWMYLFCITDNSCSLRPNDFKSMQGASDTMKMYVWLFDADNPLFTEIINTV